MSILYENLLAFQWQDIVMILLGCLLIYLAIKKEMEPSLLLPMGLGTILVNTRLMSGILSFQARI